MGAELRAGSELAGYRIESLLGRGAMGAVYLATDLRLERRVALKVLAPELARDRRFRERFMRESRLAASLDHPHIVPVFATGEADGVLFLAMRFVQGSDLHDVMGRVGRLEPRRAVELLGHVADALDTAHAAGLVHRDVKPGNILVAPGREGAEHAYLCDFGLAKHAATVASLTSERSLVGTIDYIAPEQIEGGAVDGRADVYGLGCVLYECLAGVPPFRRGMELAVVYAHLNDQPPRLSERRPELPAALDDVIARALAKDPAARFSTAGALIRAARAALAGAALDEAPPAPRVLVRTFLIADVRGYTAYTRQHGDAAAAALAASFAKLAGRAVELHAGQLVEIRGDEALAVFDSARDAFQAALTLQRDAVTAGLPRGIGIGIDAGEAIPVDGGYRGAALNLAARLCAIARAGQVLASDQARHLAGRVEGVRYRTRRPVRVKGVAEPVRSVEVLSEQPIAAVPVAVARRRRWPLAAAVGGALVLAASGVALTLRSSSKPNVVVAAPAVESGDAVVAVDPRTLRVISRIPLDPGSEPRDIAVAGGSVWVANTNSETLTHIDARSHRILKTSGVSSVEAVTADARAAWLLTRPDSKHKTWSLVRYDAATDTPGAAIALPFIADADPSNDDVAVGDGAVWLAAGRGTLLRVPTDGTGRVSSVGSRGVAFAGPIAFADHVAWSAGVVLPDGLIDVAVRVAPDGSGLTASPRVRVPPGAAPYNARLVDGIAADARTVWLVTHDNTLWRLDPTEGVAVQSVRLGPGDFTGIALGGGAVWLTDSSSGSLLRVDTTTYAVARRHIGDEAIRVAYGAGAVWVTVQAAAASTAGGTAATATTAAGRGGTLRLLAASDYDFWDGTSYYGDVWSLEAVTCNALLQYPSTRDPQVQRTLIPGVAETLPTISPDGRTYTFTIRHGLRFNDGRLLTPADVKATFDRLLDPHAGFDALVHTPYYRSIVGYRAYEHGASTISGIAVRGDTVTFGLTKPDPAFEYALAIPWACIVPRDSLHQHTPRPPPTTGPYGIASYTPKRSLLLVRNPYWASNARILGRDTAGLDNVDRITITFGVPADEQLQLITHDRADLSFDQAAAVGPSLTRIERSAALRKRLVRAPASSLRYIWFSTRIPPFSNVLLRRAVNYAIDRRKLATVVRSTILGAPTSQLLPSPLLTPGTTPDVYPETANLAEARRLVRVSGATMPVPVSYWYPNPLGSGNDAVAESLKAQLDAAGFRVTLRPADAAFYYEQIGKPQNRASMGFGGWTQDYPDGASFFLPLLNGRTDRGNDGNFDVAAVNERIDRVAALPLAAGRLRAWTRLSADIAREYAPWATYAETELAQIASSRVRNLVLSSVKGGADYALISLK